MSSMVDLWRLQQQVAYRRAKYAPDQTSDDLLGLLRDEMVKLHDAVFDEDSERAGKSVSEGIILLVAMADQMGFLSSEGVARKMSEEFRRGWHSRRSKRK